MDNLKITKAQREVLKRAAEHPLGVATIDGKANGFASASFYKMMKRLCDAGLFVDYVHGGYEITQAGREIAREALGK